MDKALLVYNVHPVFVEFNKGKNVSYNDYCNWCSENNVDIYFEFCTTAEKVHEAVAKILQLGQHYYIEPIEYQLLPDDKEDVQNNKTDYPITFKDYLLNKKDGSCSERFDFDTIDDAYQFCTKLRERLEQEGCSDVEVRHSNTVVRARLLEENIA